MTSTLPNLSNEADGEGRRVPSGLGADSLSTGVVILLGVTVLQRMVGFLRSMLFCGLMEDDQLGRWSLAAIFLTLAAPLAVLGLPGSFGRYVERFRRRGQLRAFLRRTTLVTAALGLSALLLVLLARHWFALCIFKDARQTRLVLALAGALGAVIACNFLIELFTALRRIRLVSLMQLASSLVFALMGVGLLCFTALREEAVILAFGAGALAASLWGVFQLRSVWRELPLTAQPSPHRDLWAKLLPFAAWLWVINVLANLFDGADQYMIKHFSRLDAAAADSLVGQYHCSRVVPLLLIAVAGMLSGVILPHLSSDWEAGRRHAVSQRLNLALKLVALAFTAGAVLVLLVSPMLFGWVLQGKYSQGLTVLPWTMAYCIWFSLAIVAQNYLWCAEKTRLVSLALAAGLAVNVALNLLLLPRLGLVGAVLATASANAVALALIYGLSRRLGMKLDRGVWLASALPLAIPFGGGPAAAVVLAAGWSAARGSWLFSRREKQQFAAVTRRCLERLQQVVGRRAPTSARELAENTRTT
jgi:O-antigen/teichoic acid export membrane protein